MFDLLKQAFITPTHSLNKRHSPPLSLETKTTTKPNTRHQEDSSSECGDWEWILTRSPRAHGWWSLVYHKQLLHLLTIYTEVVIGKHKSLIHDVSPRKRINVLLIPISFNHHKISLLFRRKLIRDKQSVQETNKRYNERRYLMSALREVTMTKYLMSSE